MIEVRQNLDLAQQSRRSGVAQTRITLQSPLRQRNDLSSPSTNFQDNKKIPISDQSLLDGRQIPMAQTIHTNEQIREALAVQHINRMFQIAQPSLFASRQVLAQENPYSLQVVLPELRQTNDGRQGETEPREEPDIIVLNTEMHTEENLNPEARLDTENAGRQDPDTTEDDISKTAYYRILYHFIFNAYLLISYVLGFLLISSQISTTVPFVTSLVLIVLYIFLLIKTNGFSTKQSKLSLFLSIGNSVCFIFFIIAAFIRTKTDGFLLAPFCIPGLILLFGYCTKDQINDAKTPKLLLISLKFVVWLQILLISLPLDGAPVEWNPIFVPSYFLFMMLGFFSLILAIGAVVGFVSLVNEEGFSLPTLSGSLWYILNALYVAVWFAILSQVVKRLDFGAGDLKTALLAGIIHSGIMFIYSLILWRPLCKFQELEIKSLLTPLESENASKTPQVTFKVSKESKLKLIMISPTFFQYLKSYLKTKKNKKNTVSRNTDLESQEEKKDNERLCAVCFDRASNAVLMNCGHGGVCYECALEHWKKTDNCMMCRMTIIKVLKIADPISGSNEIQVVESVKKIVKNGTL